MCLLMPKLCVDLNISQIFYNLGKLKFYPPKNQPEEMCRIEQPGEELMKHGVISF